MSDSKKMMNKPQETRLLLGDEEEEEDGEIVVEPVPSSSSGRTSATPTKKTTASQEAYNAAAAAASSTKANALINSDYMFIKLVARLAMGVLKRFWAFSSMALLAIILFYWLCGGIIAFLLIIFGITGIIYNASDFVLYQPNSPGNSRVFVPAPSVLGLNFKSIFINTRDKTRIHMFLIKHSDPEAPTMLYLHGNAGNIGHRLPNVKDLVNSVQCNVCLLEYRGYGRSDGSPSEDGLYLDAQAGLDYLSSRSDINANRILVFGRSLGGAVAIELASRIENREKIRCLIVENSFTSIPDVARSAFDVKLIRMLPNLLFKNQFRSRWKVCGVSAPTLFLSGQTDGLIPPSMMQELFNGCGAEIKRMVQFKAGGHNDTWQCKDYYPSIKYFIEEIANIRPPNSLSIQPPKGFLSETTNVV